MKRLLIILSFLPLFTLGQSPLSCSVTGTDLLCFQDNSGTIDLTVTGGVMPYTYLWTGPGGPYTTEDLSGLAAGTYNVTVTDSNGLTTSCSITLTQPSQLICSMTGVNLTCYSLPTGSIDLSVTGGILPYTFFWTGPGGPYTTEDLTGLASGTYCVIVTDANGCTTTCCITLTEPTQLVCSVTAVNTTGGLSNGSIDLTVTGGTPPYIFTWTGPGGPYNTEDLSGLAAGTYSVVVTDANGCWTTCSISLAGTNMILADFTANIVCEGDTTHFTDLSAGGTPPFSYLWDFGDGTTSISQNPSHVYDTCGTYNTSLIVTDANGLSNTVTYSVVVNCPPVANFSSMDVCEGDINIFTNLSNSPGTIVSWFWDFGDGTTSTVPNPSHVYANCGTYNVTLIVTDANGCQDTSSQVVEVHCLPIADFIWSPVPACVGLPVCFTDLSTSNSTISLWNWTFGDGSMSTTQNPVHTYFWQGFYTVDFSVTEINGCSSWFVQTVEVDTCSTSCTSTGLNNYTTSKKLLKVTDILGRDTTPKSNTLLFYIYSDGTVEKRIIIE